MWFECCGLVGFLIAVYCVRVGWCIGLHGLFGYCCYFACVCCLLSLVRVWACSFFVCFCLVLVCGCFVVGVNSVVVLRDVSRLVFRV